MGEGFELRLLGSLEVANGDDLVELGGGRQHLVLVSLAMDANRFVSVAQLIENVWGEHPPVTARQQIHSAISALRRALGGVPDWGTIRTEPAGYRLCVADERVDLLRFESAVAEGHRLLAVQRPQEAVCAFRTGLALWRGPALAGLQDQLEPYAARLEQARLAALETCLEQELAIGGGPRTLADLQEAHARHPLREGITATLMLALFQAGRQSEAIGAYRHTTAMLSDQLGVDPSSVLARRFTEILQAAEAPAPSAAEPPVPRQLPPLPAGWAGRAGWLGQLDALLPAEPRAAMPIAAISGTGGIGKTALAVHWAHRVQRRFPDGQLYVNLRGFDPVASPAAPFDVLRDFLAALGVPVEHVPDGLPGRVSLYRTLVAERRTLVVLDNARDAEQVRPLLPGSRGCLVVVTSRNQLLGLVAAEGAHAMPLDVFTPPEARDLLAQRLGAQRPAGPPAAIDEIIESCAGLPLALSIVAARLAANPGLSLAAVAAELTRTRQRLDPFAGDDATTDLRAVFSWSYRILDGAAARLFRLMGALRMGTDMPAAAAAALAGLSPAQARPLLAQLTRMHLLAEHTHGRYAFHDLVGAYAAELAHDTDTEPDRTAALGRLLDYYLQTAIAAARARQYSISDLITPPGPPPSYHATPFTEHEAALAWLVAERPALITAVDRAEDSGFPAHAWQLARVIKDFLITQDWHELHHVQLVALAAAERAAEPAAQASAHRALGHGTTLLGHLGQAEDHLQRAMRLFRELGDPLNEAHCRSNMGDICDLRGQPEEALRHERQALDDFRRYGDARGEATSLNGIGCLLTKLGAYRPAIEHAERALAVQRRAGAWQRVPAILETLAYAYFRLGEFRPALDHYRQGLEVCRKVGDRYNETIILDQMGDVLHAAGDPEPAREAWQQAIETLEALGHRSTRAVAFRRGTDLPDIASLNTKIQQRRPQREPAAASASSTPARLPAQG